MSTCEHQHAAGWRRWMRATLARFTAESRRTWHRIRWQRQPVPIVVLIADPARRRALERELRHGLAYLQRALGAPLPPGAAVLVQQAIATDRPIAGCLCLGQHADGRRFALVRLALAVNDRQLTTNELLAVLAEQSIGLLTHDRPSVLIPVELEPRPAGSTRPTAPRPDPLTLYPDGIDQQRGPGA